MARRGFEEASAYNPRDYGGGTGTPDDPNAPTAADNEVNRYRQMGQDAQGRGAYQLQFGAANADRQRGLEAHDTQTEAAGLQYGAATGDTSVAPSRAEMEGGQVAGNSLEASLRAGAGRKVGIPTEPITPQMQQSQLQGMDATSGGRLAEISRARNAFGQGVANMRAGDYQGQGLDASQANAQGQMEMSQRQRNAENQMTNEGRALGVEQQVASNQQRTVNALNSNYQARRSAQDQDSNALRSFEGDYMQSLGNLEKEAVSDHRAKTPAKLGHLEREADRLRAQTAGNQDSLRYGSSLSNGALERANGGREDPEEELARLQEEHDVHEIRYGKPNPQREAAIQQAREDAAQDLEREKTETLHRGIEARLGEDEAARPHHAESPRGYDLGTGYSVDPAGPDPWKSGPNSNTVAPGTNDYMQYGKPRQVSANRPGEWGMGMKDAPTDSYSQAVSLSDERAKQQARVEGFVDGASGRPSRVPITQAQETGEANKIEAEAGRAPLTTGSLLPSERRDHALLSMIYDPYERASRPDTRPRPAQQPGPTTARPVPPPAHENGDFSKGVERQFGGPAQGLAEKPDARAREHQERAKVKALVDSAGERMSTSDVRAKNVPRDGDTTGGSVEDPELQRDANRKLRGETYTYKEGVGEDPNQVHHGFMAQHLEENPITATAVREDGTGIKKVDNTDALRVTAAGVAQLQADNDAMQVELEKLKARRQRR